MVIKDGFKVRLSDIINVDINILKGIGKLRYYDLSLGIFYFGSLNIKINS